MNDNIAPSLSHKNPSASQWAYQESIPLALYIHIPWCIRKCPYCDFNSHQLRGAAPEMQYIDALITDLKQDLVHVQNRPIHSIFIGGGTPSLLSVAAYERLFHALFSLLKIPDDTEITLEANPGTVEQQRFSGYFALGINRLSLGIQSLNDQQLKRLGRIHNAKQALTAVDAIRNAGFQRFNLDLMHGLPQQSVAEACNDLQKIIALNPQHISWYQLTLEPQTYFYKHPPVLPADDTIAAMQTQGNTLLQEAGFTQYEISAYAKAANFCRHNINYWKFGDYLGIGAGAHSKITDCNQQTIWRYAKVKSPKAYLDHQRSFIAHKQAIPTKELPLEFMMNALRLYQPIPQPLFTQRTGLQWKSIQPTLSEAIAKNFIHLTNDYLLVTAHGKQFLNELLLLF